MDAERIAEGMGVEVGRDNEGRPYIRVKGFVTITFTQDQFEELVAQMAAIAVTLKKGG